jgi:hypothetical protein
LTTLYLNNNQLTGTIPAELGNLINLEIFYLQFNDLGGQVHLGVSTIGGSMEDCYWKPGNTGLFMPDTPEYRAADVDGDGFICGLGFTP